MKPQTVGQFEQYVLTAVMALRDRAYGVTIHAKVAELISPRTVALGAVYATLDRLEDKGFVSSWLSDPTPERGGRAKRHYRLEATGEFALHESAVALADPAEAHERGTPEEKEEGGTGSLHRC